VHKITELLKEKKFLISLELVPPRNGIDHQKLYDKISQLKGLVDFISITKGAGGSLRGGSLPVSYFAQQKFGITVLSHFVCRERTKYQLENELVDLHNFGIRNLLVLRGDPPSGSKDGWDGDYMYAYLLVNQISDMNNGLYLPRSTDEDRKQGLKTDFCMVIAGHPEDPLWQEARHMKAKVDAGAEVIITQMIFSFEDYKAYVEGLRSAGIDVPVIPGIRPLISIEQAESTETFFKIKIDDGLKHGLKKHGRKFGIKYFSDMIKKLKDYKAPGVHLFTLNDVEIVEELMNCVKK